MTTMNVVTFELLFTPVRKSKYILLFCSAQQLDQPVIIRMADQILYICRTKDQIRRRLIELLQILILFPSDRRQKYDLHLLPEPEYRFFQNCHCNKSTLLEGTLRVWECHQITIICWCKFLSLQNRCSECLRKSLLLLNLPAQVLQNRYRFWRLVPFCRTMTLTG